jgi:hypothetical protein
MSLTKEQEAAAAKAKAAEEAKLLAEMEAEEAAKKASKKGKCFVVAGKSITSKIGIVHGDIELKAEHLAGGQKALDSLIKAKLVEKL